MISSRHREIIRIMTAKVRIVSTLGLMLTYSVCFSAIKAGLAFIPPLLFSGLRAFIGGATLLVLVIALRRQLIPERRNWLAVLALAIISTTFVYGAMFVSPGLTSAGIASVLGKIQPLFALLLAARFLGEQITVRKLAALVLGLAGIILISYASMAGYDGDEMLGIVLAVAVSAGSAAGSVIIKRMGVRRDLMAIAAWQLIIGSLPLLAASALSEKNTAVVWNTELVSLLLFLALVGTSFATAFWYWLIYQDDVSRLTMFFFLVPAIGLGIATLTFGEKIGFIEGIGAILTVLGVGAIAKSPNAIRRNLPPLKI